MTEKEGVVVRQKRIVRKPSRRDGSVGRETFERVEALLAEGKNKTQAIAQVASEMGKNSGTVSANYYRVARASAAVSPQGRRAATAPVAETKLRTQEKSKRRTAVPRSTTRREAHAPTGDSGSIDRVAANLVSSVEALAALVRAQETELSDLRGRLDRLRGLLS
jgi:hypothetical protein